MGSWGVASILGPEVVDPGGGGGGGPCVLPPGFWVHQYGVSSFLEFGTFSSVVVLGPRNGTLVEFDFWVENFLFSLVYF